ncbi:MAG: D-alanine--poly(phosphoribitol) ligase [Chlorobi bacterium]|nr:D-alanine--poly(phosphoribitol) ligase [Chlorobiota bacterium]
MGILASLEKSISGHLDRNAFHINGNSFTYNDLAKSISKIRVAIRNKTDSTEKHIGLVANNDLDTYGAILAIWFEGKAYVPIGTDTPKSRNLEMMGQTEVKSIIDTSATPLFPGKNTIQPAMLPNAEMDLAMEKVSSDDICIILFTSGTTGTPKGVPITHAMLGAFMDAFWKLGLEIDENDKCLQMFEITFDFSIVAYLASLLKGACTYTVPQDSIKYAYIYELLEDHGLTTIYLIPSILLYLRPYFEEIDLPLMKNCIMGGEGLQVVLAEEWAKCIPNAKIVNIYGPTEDTLFVTCYPLRRTGKNKSHNGILALGKTMSGSHIIVIDEDKNILPTGEKGELCLAGPQLTPGYWKNEERNKKVFFNAMYDGEQRRFYRTGDLCYFDEEGDIYFVGRIDFQAKIQGYRVELSEVEFHAQTVLGKTNVVAIAYQTKIGSTELGLVIETEEFKTEGLIEQMKVKVDAYMVPSKIKFVNEFPLNKNGKIDRKELSRLFQG